MITLELTRPKLTTTNKVDAVLQPGTVVETDTSTEESFFIPINFGGQDPASFTVENCTTTISTTVRSVNNFTSAGVQAGDPVSGTGVPASTTVVSVAGDGLSLTLSQAATAVGTVTLTFDPPSFTIADCTTTDTSTTVTTINNFDTAGVRVGDEVTGAGIPVSTTVASIAGDGLSLELSQAANATGTVILTFDTPGFTVDDCQTTNVGTTVTSTNNFNTAGVQAGDPVSGTGVPASTTVVSVAGDGLSLVLSQAATASGTVTLTFDPTAFINPPPFTVADCTTANGAVAVTTTNNFLEAGVKVGDPVSGTGVQASTTVASVAVDGLSLELSLPANAAGTVELSFDPPAISQATVYALKVTHSKLLANFSMNVELYTYDGSLANTPGTSENASQTITLAPVTGSAQVDMDAFLTNLRIPRTA
ncbi:MAG: hypothetical protein F6K31_12915 [Symploca sp. SIO2G7]|nr:hypothetical protein [Symploca sp. SIO2G7]